MTFLKMRFISVFCWEVSTCTYIVTILNEIYSARDRDGEDTHQNIIQDTVLSFGKPSKHLTVWLMY